MNKLRILSLLIPSVMLNAASIAADELPVECTEKSLKQEPNKRPDENDRREELLRRCGTELSNDEYVLKNGDIRRYLTLINDEFLAKYDLDCDLKLSSDEQAQYAKDHAKKAPKLFRDAKCAVAERAKYRIDKWERRTASNGAHIGSTIALEVNPDPIPKERSLSVGYTVASDNAQKTDGVKLGFTFKQTPWASPTTNSTLFRSRSFDFEWKKVKTATAKTTTRSVDFLPLKYTVTPVKDLTFSASGGLAYLITDKKDLIEQLKTKDSNLAYVYKFGVEMQTALPWLSVGLDYKIRLDEVFDERLSYEWVPNVTFDLTKIGAGN